MNNDNNNNNNNNDNNSNNTSQENVCNCKIKINCPMKSLCNLKNVISQGIIFVKENIKNKKKLYRNFIDEMKIKV